MKRGGTLTRRKRLESRTVLRRTPLSPGSSTLARTGTLKRAGSVTSKKPSTAARRRTRQQARAERTYGDHAAWIRAQLCALSWVFGRGRNRITASHAWHTRGSTGTAKDCLPMLLALEEEIHAVGRVTFSAEHAVDLDAAAAWYAALSPALNPSLAATLRPLACAGPCSNRGPHVAVLMPDGTHLACCGEPHCRWELEEHVRREFIERGVLPPFFCEVAA